MNVAWQFWAGDDSTHGRHWWLALLLPVEENEQEEENQFALHKRTETVLILSKSRCCPWGRLF